MAYQNQQQNTYPAFEYGPMSSAAMLRGTMRTNDPSQPGPARYKEYERKREGFRRYLEQYGVLDMITNVLTNMHDNIDWSVAVPPNGLDVFRQLLLKGTDGYLPEEREILRMQHELMELKGLNKRLHEELHKYTVQQHQRHMPMNMGQLDVQFEEMGIAGSSGDSAGNVQAQQSAMNAGTPIHAQKQQINNKSTPPEMSRR